MQYCLLLWPHANARYQKESFKLALLELELSLNKVCPEYKILPVNEGMLPELRFEVPQALSQEAVSLLSRQSLLYGLFQAQGDGSLLPITGRKEASIGADLPGILKYKGKTNELFTELLINLAYLSAGMPENPKFLDPMCGRGTAVFVAANRGWDATGSDIDSRDLSEAANFFKRYLEYHRLKHRQQLGSLTLARKKSAKVTYFQLAEQVLRFVEVDARLVAEAFGKGKFHILAADLPYGIQHSGFKLEDLLSSALPAWRRVLKPGGALALSFNAQSISSSQVRQLMERGGFTVQSGGPYDCFSHWVEQAVTRDIAIGVVSP